MPLAYNAKRCMFFVGGDDVKANNGSAGQSTAGGCTKEWWDDEVAANGVATAMAKLMGTDGGLVDDVANAVSTDEGGGYVRITKTDGFGNSEAGMIATVHDHGAEMDDGLLELISVDPSGHYIVVETTISSSSNIVDVSVGGAWVSIAYAADSITAANYTQEVWCNKDFALSASLNAGVWGDGNKLKDTWLNVRGFNRYPYDMHKGGEFYQSAADAKLNGVETTAAVHVDFQDNDIAGLVLNGNENIILENIYCLDVTITGTRASVHFLNMPENIIFNHCFCRGGVYAFQGEANGLYFLDCLGDVSTHAASGFAFIFNPGSVVFYDNCAVKLGPGGAGFSSLGSPLFTNNCFVSGGRVAAGTLLGGKAFHTNAVFYNQNDAAFETTSPANNGLVVARNSIMMLATQADIAYRVHANGGSTFDDYNCIYSLAGALTAIGDNAYSGGQAAEPGENTLQVDPQLTDAAGGNFTPKNKNVLLGGSLDPGEVKGHMGCIGQEWNFGDRSRAGNVGRLGIFR